MKTLPGYRCQTFSLFVITLFLCLNLHASDSAALIPNSTEEELADLITGHVLQGRSEMDYDPTLSVVARAKALDLGQRGYFDHVDPDGYGPNRAVQLAGYRLPSNWGEAIDTNFIESIAAGHTNALRVFRAWLASSAHRTHVLGSDAFFASQTKFGVGYVEVSGSPHTHYYVFISVPSHPDNVDGLEGYASWLFDRFSLPELDADSDETDHDHDGLPRITEFALDMDPFERDQLPQPILNRETNRLEWNLPIRDFLGSVEATVQCTRDLRYWTREGVTQSDQTFSISLDEGMGFMRLQTTRDVEESDRGMAAAGG